MLSLLSKLVHSISLRKVILWSLTFLLIVFGYTAYEHRVELYEFTMNQQKPGNEVGVTFIVSEKSKEKVKEIVNSDPRIEGISILSVDLRLNERVDLYHYSDPKKGAALDNFMAKRLPLFTKNNDNNRQMIKLLNGEFSCAPYSDSNLSKTFPNLNKNVVSICTVSLPPYYGDFSGFIIAILNAEPDIESQLRLKQQLETLATRLYLQDVIPTTRKATL